MSKPQNRRRKVLVVGSTEFSFLDDDNSVASVDWDTAEHSPSLRDYDVVVFNLLSGHAQKWTDESYNQRLKTSVLHDIVDNGGSIIVLGDPRTSMSYGSAPHFLDWFGFGFTWKAGSGDTIHLQPDAADFKKFASYLRNLKRWKYSLAGVTLNRISWMGILGAGWLAGDTKRVDLSTNVLAKNRYGASLASVHRFQYTKIVPFPTQHWDTERVSGPIAFLPNVELPESEAIALILQDSLGIPLQAREPEWLAMAVAPTGQQALDEEMVRVREARAELRQRDQELQAKRKELRAPMGLLFQTGAALEDAVWMAFEKLGAEVTRPSTRGQEDGWISLSVGDERFQGVLEIKSAKNERFAEEGIRQLLEWIQRGIVEHSIRYKGLFIGNSMTATDPSSRPDPFTVNFAKKAAISDIAAFLTEDLYRALLLDDAGRLNRDQFWNAIFSARGVVDFGFLRTELPSVMTSPPKADDLEA